MDDPVLDAHEVSPGIYLLSGTHLRPVSIRDQILRGTVLIRRLIETKVLDELTPLLIVGAGVAGVAAAIEASRNSVETVLIEKKPAPFTTLEAARTRLVDPVLYDWPVEHWRDVKFPWGPHDLPLEFTLSLGSDIAALWTKSLMDANLTSQGKLTVLYNETIKSGGIHPMTNPNVWPFRVDFSSSRTQHPFRVIVWAAGFGHENRFVMDDSTKPSRTLYEGVPFWGSDIFSHLGPVVPNPRVLISGAGDGALQDYIRIVTKTDDIRAFYQACQIPPAILHKIQSVEDRAHRGISWASDVKELGRAHEQSYRAELHKVHQEAVADACKAPQVCEALTVLLSDPPAINVVYRGRFLTAYYGLNRFLALLISSFIEKQNLSKSGAHFLPYTRIVSLGPAPSSPHNCLDFSVLGKIRANGDYQRLGPSGEEELIKHECLGKDHSVILETTPPSQAPVLAPEQSFNVIIIRHGPDDLPQFPHSSPPALPRPRHLWPYHLPTGDDLKD